MALARWVSCANSRCGVSTGSSISRVRSSASRESTSSRTPFSARMAPVPASARYEPTRGALVARLFAPSSWTTSARIESRARCDDGASVGAAARASARNKSACKAESRDAKRARAACTSATRGTVSRCVSDVPPAARWTPTRSARTPRRAKPATHTSANTSSPTGTNGRSRREASNARAANQSARDSELGIGLGISGILRRDGRVRIPDPPVSQPAPYGARPRALLDRDDALHVHRQVRRAEVRIRARLDVAERERERFARYHHQLAGKFGNLLGA